MPIYAYRCGTCGRGTDHFNRIADRQHGPECCGAAMAQQLTACMVQVPGGIDVGYKCQVTGEVVQSMRKRKYIMDKHGLVDAREVHGEVKRKIRREQAEIAEAQAEIAKLPDAVKAAALPPAGA